MCWTGLEMHLLKLLVLGAWNLLTAVNFKKKLVPSHNMWAEHGHLLIPLLRLQKWKIIKTSRAFPSLPTLKPSSLIVSCLLVGTPSNPFPSATMTLLAQSLRTYHQAASAALSADSWISWLHPETVTPHHHPGPLPLGCSTPQASLDNSPNKQLPSQV